MATNSDKFEVVLKEKEEALWINKSPIVKIDKEVYFRRVMIEITSNPELFKISKTPTGRFSILAEVSKAIGMGLQIGNQIPQAYLLPYAGKVRLCPTAEGLKFIVKSAPDPNDPNSKPILKSFDLIPIYEGDKIHLETFGEISHTPDITKKRRELIGVAARIVQQDGNFNNKFISRGDIEEIRDKWSPQPEGKAWKNSFDQMAMAKAAKRFLSEYAASSEALRNALEINPEAQNPDIEERVPNLLNDVIVVTPEPGEKKTEAKQDQKKTEVSDNKEKPKEGEDDIF